MGLTDPTEENPYVGPRPFERADRSNFFGRDREAQELLSLVIAHRLVLLYAASGTGKTSLLDAALLPLLEQNGFAVLPLGRLRGLLTEQAAPSSNGNVYTLGVLSNWSDALGAPAALAIADASGTGGALAEFVQGYRRTLGAGDSRTPIAMVLDQFEELLSLYPERWRERSGFVDELTGALEADPLLRVVLAIREDYLAQLDPFAESLPGGLRNRFRLERLGPGAALVAVTNPLRNGPRSFAPGVAESLVDDLLKVRVDRGQGRVVEAVGEFVEPVQLQVACNSLWAKLPEDAETITEDHLRLFGDVDTVLARYYDEAVEAAVEQGNVNERRLRERLEEGFITPLGTRSTVFQAGGQAAGIPDEAITELENRHLIRAEVRSGARWYELTHDRLIEPIRASNRRRLGELGRRRRRVIYAATAVGAVLLGVALGLSLWQLRGPETFALLDQTALIAKPDVTIHTGGITGVALSPDGRLVATAHDDHGIVIWATATGGAVAVSRGHTKQANSVAFSPNNDRIVTSSADKTARIWDARTGRQIHVLSGHKGDVNDARFDAAGKRIVTASEDGTARIWDARTGKLLDVLRSGDDDPIESATFNRDGSRLLTDELTDEQLWNARTGTSIATLDSFTGLETAVFSRDGKRVIAAGSDGFVGTYDASSGTELEEFPFGDGDFVAAAFGPSGKYAATLSDIGRLYIWDSHTTEKIAELRLGAPFYDGGGVAFSPNGGLVVTSSGDASAVWDVPTGKLRAVLPGTSFFYGEEYPQFSADGRVLVTFSPEGARVSEIDSVLHQRG